MSLTNSKPERERETETVNLPIKKSWILHAAPWLIGALLGTHAGQFLPHEAAPVACTNFEHHLERLQTEIAAMRGDIQTLDREIDIVLHLNGIGTSGDGRHYNFSRNLTTNGN